MAIRFVKSDTTTMFKSSTGYDRSIDLLWGDRVRTGSTSHGRTKVKARGKQGWVATSDLGTESLLEVYFIDVGQGDGVLIRTPDHRHILIDGGWPRRNQDTGKNAADFVDWKFVRDYGKRRIDLDAIIASHNDADHYGGLWDLINPDETEELEARDVRVDAMYHAGVSWWKNPQKPRFLGPKIPTTEGPFLSLLLQDRNHVLKKLKSNANPKLQGEWAKFLQCVTQTKRRNGTSPTVIERLSHITEFLPGFLPGRAPIPGERHGDVAIKVLGPVEYETGGRPILRSLGRDDKNTNGNSILLRLDYGRTRILLTGDLNAKAQRALLADYEGERLEFECDVAKACHHGSEDVSYEFLAALNPAVTVISSGDNEGHDHPRPSIIAASATTGRLQVDEDEMISPLVYSTELARSVSFGDPSKLTVPAAAGVPEREITGATLDKAEIEYKETKAGDRTPRTRTRKLGHSLVVAGVIYGLVNVRTDGENILCAALNEKNYSWKIKKVKSRF